MSFVVRLVLVPKKKKIRKFSATTAVKSAAREALGTPLPVRRLESKKRGKKEKHKATVAKLLAEGSN